MSPSAVDDPLAEPELAGVERDIDVAIEILGGQAAADLAARLLAFALLVTPTTV